MSRRSRLYSYAVRNWNSFLRGLDPIDRVVWTGMTTRAGAMDYLRDWDVPWNGKVPVRHYPRPVRWFRAQRRAGGR